MNNGVGKKKRNNRKLRNDVQEKLELERVGLELERVYEEVQMREW